MKKCFPPKKALQLGFRAIRYKNPSLRIQFLGHVFSQKKFQLRKLKRDIRRLDEYRRNLHPSLYQKFLASQTYFLKVWPHLSEPGLLADIRKLQSWAIHVDTDTRAATKKAALERIAFSDSRAYCWIKRLVETEKSRELEDLTPVAPEDQVEHVKKQLESIWMQPPEQDFQMIESRFASHSEHPEVSIDYSDICKLAKKAKGKAAGPDGWQGKHFASLPPCATLAHLPSSLSAAGQLV